VNLYRRYGVRRSLIFAIGCASLAWGALAFPRSDPSDNLRDLESRLLRFQTFSPQTVTQELQSGGYLSSCDTHSQRAMLLMEMPLAEEALRSGAAAAFDQHVKALEARTRLILSCAPRESVVWLVAFDLEILHGLLNEHAFNLLAMSYETSPNEAWISIRRTSVAVPLIPIVPEPLQEQILNEFEQLIRNGFVDAAARSYLNGSQAVRSLLQAHIEKLDVAEQQAFSFALKKLSS
jgi:hypothetical protein